jgi:hypothetical protein
MGASWPDEDDFDAERAEMEAHYDGADPFVETDHDAPLRPSAPNASKLAPEKPKGDESKARVIVDDSHKEKNDVECGGTVAPSEKAKAKKSSVAEVTPEMLAAKTNGGKGKKRGRPHLHLVDPEKPEQGDGRTVIHLDPDQLHTSVELVHIRLGRTGKVFVRGHIPVEVRGFESHSEKKEGPIAEGSPVVMQIRSPTMAVIMAENCKFRQKKIIDDEPRECKTNPPDALATKVCETASRGNHIPPILGVLECPSMRPDGTLILEKGYDEATGYYLASNLVLPHIPDRPTIEHLQWAIETLRLLFSGPRDGKYGFFWSNPEKDWVVPIAAFLGLLARPAIIPPNGGIPATVLRGTTPGTGKGTIIDVVCILATGRTAPISSWPTEKDEQEKELGAIALASAPIAFWDEVQEAPGRVFVSGRLQAATTADQTAFRVLGFSQMPVLPWRTVPFFAGNNFTIDANLARRLICVNLESPVEKPAELSPDQFIWPDPRKEALDNRAKYVAAGLTILRYFHVMGRPKQGVTIGSFQKFADLVGGALKLAGAPNIADYVDKDPDTETAEQGGMRVVVREWARLPGVTEKTGLSIAAAISFLYPDERLRKIKSGEPVAPDGFDELREALESMAPPRAGMMKPDTEKLGKVFRSVQKTPFGEVRLVSVKNAKGLPFNPAKWGVEKMARWNGCSDPSCDCKPCEKCHSPPGYYPSEAARCKKKSANDGGCTCGPNGCRYAECNCKPCRQCGWCTLRARDDGGCTCGVNGCRHWECDCRPCDTCKKCTGITPMGQGGCYC